MAGKNFNGRYPNGIVLTSADNPATSEAGAYVTNTTTASNPAIFGAAGTTWTVTNLGTVKPTGTSAAGVDLVSGGTVVNGSTGVTTALISSGDNTVFLGGVGKVANYGTIASTSIRTTGTLFYGTGVFLERGGVVVNGAAGDTHALIRSMETGVYAGGVNGVPNTNASATVTNFGTVQTTGTGTLAASGVFLADSGSVNNQGTIESVGSDGVFIQSGGTVVNGSTAETSAFIIGSQAVSFRKGVGTVINFGTIQSTATTEHVGVHLANGGSLTNGFSGSTTGLITAYRDAIYIGGNDGTTYPGAVGTITNFGTIQSTGTSSATGGHNAIFMAEGGTVTNQGMIAGSWDGVGIEGALGVVTNFGTIESTSAGTSGEAIYLGDGGSVTNYGLIKGARAPTSSGYAGVIVTHAQYATILNFGTISPTNVNNGVNLDHGGTIINGSTSATRA